MRKSKHFARYIVYYEGDPPYSMGSWEVAHETDTPLGLDYLTGGLLAEVLAGEYMATQIKIVIYASVAPTVEFVSLGALPEWRRVVVRDTSMIRPIGAPPLSEAHQARIHEIDKANIQIFLESEAGQQIAGRTRHAALAVLGSGHRQLTNVLAHWFANWTIYGGQWQEQAIQDLIITFEQ